MDKAAENTIEVLDELLSGQRSDEVGFRLWDGTWWPDDRTRPVTVVLNHPGALRRMFFPSNDLNLGEAYLYNDFDIEGDVEALFGTAESLAETVSGVGARIRLARAVLRLPKSKRASSSKRGPAELSGERHSIQRDREAIAYHYNVSNDFYALWLGERMVYSCAYFHTPDDSLDLAQEQKQDHICRKLQLQPGQRFLDIGCGWGGLVIYAAERYGVEALGITLSEPQAALANKRIAEAGLTDRCIVELLDYRELVEPQGFDAMASIGMFEHVGEARLPTYFHQAWDLLRPGGLFLNHGITHKADAPRRRGPSFSEAYVFPDGELTPVSTSLRVAENEGFEVRDVESLREHYAMTLRHWVRNLESHHDQALDFVDEPTYRIWRLFMSGSAHGFSNGRLNVHQALLAKLDPDGHIGLPLTRAHLYAV